MSTLRRAREVRAVVSALAQGVRSRALVPLWIACAVVGCSDASSLVRDAGGDRVAEVDLGQRIDALEKAERIAFWLGDFDGDGALEIALSGLAAPDTTADVGTVAQALVVAGPSVLDVVLTHDAAGNLIPAVSNRGLNFSVAEAAGWVLVAPLKESVARLLNALRAGQYAACDGITAVVEMLGDAVKLGWLARSYFPPLVIAVLGLPVSARETVDDQKIIECLGTPQTTTGCIAIQLSALCGTSTSGLCAWIGVRNHCYQVPSGGGSGTCTEPPARSALCRKDDNPSGCCNQQFVFETIFRSDLRNMAPMPERPATGSIGGAPLEVILSGVQIPKNVLFALPDPSGAVAAIGCIVNGAVATRNPITLSASSDTYCGRNETRPGHVLQGTVDQCIREDAIGVYSTIVGTGTNTRYAGLNEYAGPGLLGAVRDIFVANVASALHEIKVRGLCCEGNTVRGGSVTVLPAGGLAYTADSTPGSCANPDGGVADGGIERPDGGEAALCPPDGANPDPTFLSIDALEVGPSPIAVDASVNVHWRVRALSYASNLPMQLYVSPTAELQPSLAQQSVFADALVVQPGALTTDDRSRSCMRYAPNQSSVPTLVCGASALSLPAIAAGQTAYAILKVCTPCGFQPSKRSCQTRSVPIVFSKS